MKAHRLPLSTAALLALAALLVPTPRAAADSSDIAAVSSTASEDYFRVKRADGSFEPESYVFGSGGRRAGAVHDETIDPVTFMDVAHVVALPLSNRGYIPSTDPKKTKFLIMVYWGLTDTPGAASGSAAYSNFADAQATLQQESSGPPTAVTARGAPTVKTGATASANPSDAALDQMTAATAVLNSENHRRDQIDFSNAELLGYDSEGLIGTDYGNAQRGLARDYKREELVGEIEQNRYFVILMAYDFQLLWKEKKHKLVWMTRFSMRESGHDFARDLPKMARYASSYFGTSTKGLVREVFPEGKVNIGELKSLGEVEPK
jgi:hypothetical protein